jgi:alkylhydroperoxidase family enzyme
VLLQLYTDEDVRNAVVADPQTAPIPDNHKAAFRFTKRFVRASWEMGEADFQDLRDVGLTDANIVNWATLGSTQTWFTMSADGGGIPLDTNGDVGFVVGKNRATYHSAQEGKLAPAVGETVKRGVRGEAAKLGQNISCTEYLAAAKDAQARYGFVPNLYKAVSLEPQYYARHAMALELLERPQSASLSPRRHAMVRALVSQITRSPYGQVTTKALLSREAELGLWDKLGRYPEGDFDAGDKAVLDFANKVARNAYKVTAKDAQSFRDAGLDDEAYVDALNTTSIQVSLDRLANCLNVQPDVQAILPIEEATQAAE